MKIVIMGLCNYDNMGDLILPKTVEYLVKDINPNIDIVFLNFLDIESNKFNAYKKRRSRIMSLRDSEFKYRCIYHLMRNYSLKTYLNYIKNSDAVIIASGSYKYGTQQLWASYSIAIEAATKCNVPIMLNGMNVQVFNQADYRCRLLSKYTSMPIVKVFSTRDGIAGIKELKNYIKNNTTQIFDVGDTAFWTKECYQPSSSKSNIIGVNMIREQIFTDYGTNISDDYLYSVYINVLEELTKRGYKWELYTNGMKEDLAFGKQLLSRMNTNEQEHPIYVPLSEKDFVNKLYSYKAIIAARLHSSIIAYSIDVPFSGFIWDKKITYFAETSHLTEHFSTEDDFNAISLVNKMEYALTHPIDINKQQALKEKTRNAIRVFLETL